MSLLICKMCGGDLEITEGMTTARCPYCGTNQTLPKLDNERRLRLYDRANHFRRSNDYDKAMAVYEQILNEDQTDSEAYWSIVLCRYGIEYVEDPVTHRRVPTINRTQYTSVLADEDYKAALRYADSCQAGIYEQEAKAIDMIQKGILLVSQREDPYDIFICCKEADENGNRTQDSVLADELYYNLTRNGFRVFFARITLRDKLGAAYEPYIFAALHSAKVMVVIGTRPDNFQAVWVRNEWSRYLSLIRLGEKKVLIPAYRDMDPYDLPKEFSHLQALDMSRFGFIQDLIYSLNQIFAKEKVRKTWWEKYGWAIGVTLGIVLVSILMLLDLKGVYKRWRASYTKEIEATAQAETIERSKEQEKAEEDLIIRDTEQEESAVQAEKADEGNNFTGIMEQFVSRVYNCPAEDVSDSRLAKMQQLVIRRNRKTWQIGYSFDAPDENLIKGFEEDPEDSSGDSLEWMLFSSETGIDLSGLGRFVNLKKLDIDAVIDAEDIKGLPLQSVSAYFYNPAEAAGMLEDPGAIKELGFNAGTEDLDGLDSFQNLETLYIEYSELDNIDALIHVKRLKNLTLMNGENLTDFEVLGKLQDLEKLYLETEGLKSIKFISSLKHLDTLKMEWTKLNALYGLEECGELKSLSIIVCPELKEMSAVSNLQNLEELCLEVPYGCPEPKLDSLTKLRKLTLDNYQDCSFIGNMINLTELNLSDCNLPKGIDTSKISSLKKFSYTTNGMKEVRIADVEAFWTLESLNLHGTACYSDISGIFRMPNLRELDISGMYCEIDFDKITENSTLEILNMDEIHLLRNAKFESIDGMTMGGWDDVAIDEHIDFLSQFTGLKELHLSEDGLTGLAFASGMSSLEVLDISENYITDLKPLAELPSLQKVICAGSPIADEDVLKDSVVIITESE